MKSLGIFVFGFFLSLSVHGEEYILRGSVPPLVDLSQGSLVKVLPRLGGRVMRMSLNQAENLKSRGFEIELNESIRLFSEGEAQPGTSMPWYLDAVHAREANAEAQDGGKASVPMAPVTICIVDTGADVMAADLLSAVTGGVNMVTGGDPKDLSDGVHHGTALASLMAGRGITSVTGVAPKAMIYVVKVFDNKGVSSNADVAEGILSCIGKAQVINLSFGTFTESAAVRMAIDKALEAGISVIAAAGNEGNDIAFPARYAPVISVGSITKQFTIAEFSGCGRELDIVAPGKDLPVLIPGGTVAVVSGTSYSAAIVSGIEALRLMHAKPKLMTRDLGFPPNNQGRGLVDAWLTIF